MDDKQVEQLKTNQWKFLKKVEHYFQFDTLQATFKKEIIGGITTFLSLMYILSVEPSMLGQANSINGGETMNAFGVFLGLCLASFLSTFVMGLFANIPVAVAPAMGINVMFVFNIAGTGDLTLIGYEGALIATTISSILFLILSITPLRRIIINSIPDPLLIAIGVGIGFFVAYVGITNMGWVKQTGGIPSADLGDLKSNYPGIILGTGLLFIMLFFYVRKINGGVAIALILGLIIALMIANLGPNLSVSQEKGIFSAANFKINGGWSYDFLGFKSNITNTWKEFVNPEIWSQPTMYISIFIMLFLNFFDATGTIATFNNQLNSISPVERKLTQKALVIDSASTVIGSGFGVSPLGVFVESQAGISQGARTGFAAIITSFFFLISIALFPIFKAIPLCVSGSACIFVGIMMISSIVEIDWKKPEFGISAFLAIIFMVVTYSIANGIGIMIISYTLIKMFKKEFKDLSITMYLLPLVFIGYFVAYAFIQVS